MKKLILILIIAACGIGSMAQNLQEIYKSGTVELIADTEYAQGNNWEEVFRSYYDTLYNKPMGNRKSIVVLPDGGVVVNHAYRDYYTEFAANGSFEKEFGITNKEGRKLRKAYRISGLGTEETFITSLDNMGNLRCLDFDGNIKKTLKLDYMARQILPLPNGNIAVVGWVIWKTKIRDFVAIVDYKTNKQTIVWEHFTGRGEIGKPSKLFNYSYRFEKQGAISCTTMPFSSNNGIKARPKLAVINKQLVVANPTSGEISTFSLDGKLLSKQQMNLKAGQISVEEQRIIQQKAIEKYQSLDPLRFEGFAGKASARESKKVHNYLIQEMEADLKKINEPISKPFFSTQIRDSEDNLLFFDFAQKQDANSFNVWVFKNGGGFICQSSFVCKDYHLQINPSKMVFHKGYLYSLQEEKGAQGNPLRLVRFKLKGAQ